MRVVQAGRVELDELHVRHPAAGAPGHGDAVAGGGVGIGGVEIDLAGAAGGQHGMLGGKGSNLAAGLVEHIGAMAGVVLKPELVAGDQVDGDVVFQQGDVGMAPDLFRQRGLHRVAGGVGGVDDAAVAVAAFARQVVAGAIVGVPGERYALFDQPFDGGPAVFHDEAGGFFVAQPGAGDQRVAECALRPSRRPPARRRCRPAPSRWRHPSSPAW